MKGQIINTIENLPAKNPNPVLIVANDGTVLYSNETAKPLLIEWDVEVGEKLPLSVGDLVERVISSNSPEKMEVKVGKRAYLIVFHPLPKQKSVNISGFDVSDQREVEERLRIKEKQNDVLHKIGKIALEYDSLQTFLDESMKMIANILKLEYCKILELLPNGNFLLKAGIGWKTGLVGKAVVEGDMESLVGYTLHSSKPVIVENFEEEKRFNKPEILKIHGVVSGVSVVIGRRGKIFGVLGVHSTIKRRFTSDDTYFFNSVAILIAQVIERKKAEDALKKAHDKCKGLVKERTTELEEAYYSLKDSERSLTEAQELAHVGNWVWDIKTDKGDWSDELYCIFERNHQESAPTYDEYLNYVHPDDRKYVTDAFQKAINGIPYSIDHRIVLANGEERTIHIKSKVVFDEKNTPIQVKGIVQDITERKKAKEKIERLANIIEYTNDGIGLITPEGIVLEWNKGEEQIYGYNIEDIVGRHISVLAPPHMKNEPMDHIELIRQTRTSFNYTASRMRKDGKTIDVSITLAPVFDSHGELTAISFITRDITEQKRAEEKLRESEEKYRNIVETANEGISLINSEGVITFVNQKMADMLGYSIEEVVNKKIWDFVEEEKKSTVIKGFEGRMHGSKCNSFEFELLRKDGSNLWVLINARDIFDSEGKFSGSLNLHTDITQRKKDEEAINYIEIARKKEIHHRIKNNLQVISSLLDLQADKIKHKNNITKSEVLEAFKESQDRVISMALIHEELHKDGKLDSLNFSHYVKELVDNLLLTYRLGNEDILLDMDIEEDVFFDMDTSVPLGMIINELLSNSLKYAFPDRENGEIQIKLHREESGECEIEHLYTAYILSISDNGVGIPEDLNIENLDSLGLQLVTTLVEQLDGELKLKRNNGTEFIIRFTGAENKNHVKVIS